MESVSEETLPLASGLSTPSLRLATHRIGIKTAFQPICDLNTRAILGYEALLRPFDACCQRWLSPLSLLAEMPSPHLEQELEWLGMHLCRASESLPASTAVFLNVEPSTLAASPDKLVAALAPSRFGWSSSQVVLEVTERGRGKIPQGVWRKAIAVIRQGGFRLAVDDWNLEHEGWSPLDWLAPDYAKIGPAGCLLDGDHGLDIARLIRHLQNRGIGCIVEGIEEEREIEQARQLGATWGQGMALAAPSIVGLDPLGLEA
ncbi:MAG: EAL domain-containing protein [Firmicutes bacterium]|nr:EAL domain-containing protein [Bacillota bacterium]